jgi:hypothetical protein
MFGEYQSSDAVISLIESTHDLTDIETLANAPFHVACRSTSKATPTTAGRVATTARMRGIL